MTEPMQEQIDREGEAAQTFAEKCCSDYGCDFLSLAEITYEAQRMLARRALEARDEACDRFRDAVESQQRSAVVANSQIICLNLLDAIDALRGGKR